MQKVFTNSSVVPCDLLVSILDSEGIPATITNELGSAASGYALPTLDNPSLPWAWPAVWVADEHYEGAMEIVEGFQTNRSSEPEG